MVKTLLLLSFLSFGLQMAFSATDLVNTDYTTKDFAGEPGDPPIPGDPS